ncbi:MAG: hypothetical protein L3K23_05860 [Thermoplasmata archaeon]|nr:hypothetical protein [Thermoplasmata archaeon]
MSRRWLTVVTVLGVAALAVGVAALVLPFALPGYPGSLTPRSPQTIYDKQLDAPLREYCTAYDQMGNCVSFGETVIGFDNLTVPGADGTLGVVNLSFSLNHSCNTCLLELFRGNLSTGPLFVGGSSEIGVLLNGSSSEVGLLPAGIEHVLLVNERFGAYNGPVSLLLAVVYEGTLFYR